MNNQYRVVWNDSTHTWMAVAETARSHGKSRSSRTGTVAHNLALVLRPLAMALAVWCGLVHAAPPAATQLPTGGQVVAGQATIGQVGQSAVLNVNQTSASAVINWNTFNLGSAASVNFAQPDRNAAVLNRVLDANPSQIYGRISAPGQVFFSNPSGMYFAPSASVDVGGLVATTHSISTADFMAGKYNFTRNGASGAIVNEGQLQAALGGYVALLAPEVRNHGVVLAQMGAVALAAGESYQLQIQGSRLSQIDVTPATIRTLVENGQAVLAPEGWIVLSAKAAQQLEASVVNTGQLAANSLTERGGRIVLESTGSVTAGGSIQANSAQGQGGRVTLTGEHISLTADSDIQATGASGGGTVLVGGDWQGSNGVPQASSVVMAESARIDASATDNGNGGKVVLWSDVHKAEGQTTVHGSIRARAGVQGGDGGQIETSGHQVDIVGARIDAGADQGQGGLWLLDPYNYTVGAGEAATIVTALNSGTSFTVDTANANGSGLTGSAGTGVITVNSAIAKSAGGAATLTLNAADSIVLNAGISATSGSLDVTMNATSGSISGSGNLALRSGMATFNQATDGIYSGAIGDVMPLQVTKSGTGTLIVTGANGSRSSANIVRVTGGTLQIGNNGTLGSFGSTSVDVASGATLAFKRSDDQTLSTVISGAGSVSQLANSNLTLTGNFGAGFTGDLIINAGQLTLSSPNDNTFTGSAIRINNGSSLGLNSIRLNRTYRLGTNIIFDANGGGSVKLMQNTTNLMVTGSLTFTTNGGAQNRFYSTVGTSWGLNTNSGNVIFNTAAGSNTANGDLTIEVPMVNGGVVTKNGAGSVVITQNPTSGLTTLPYSTVAVNAGTFKVGNGGTGGLLGSGTATVAAGATLEFNRSDNVTVANSITGAGALTQQGSGSLTLSNNPNYSGGTHINNGSLVWQNDAPSTSSSGFDGTGSLTIQPASSSFTSAFSTTDWNLANTLSGLTVGKVGNSAGITIPNAISIAGPINLIGGDLAINAALTATGGNTISLSSSGTVSDGVGGALSASKLLLSGGNVTLDSSSNAIGTLAATGVSGLTFVNGAALTLGTVGATNGVSASGVVDMSTTSGDLTVSQSVSTTNATASALTLNAGSASAALTSTGGNLLFSGSGAVSVGTGGTAKLYSGSISDSTGLTTLVGGSGSGRFRYGSDESTTNYSLSLNTGLNAIYREQPTVTRVVNDQTINYGSNWTNTFSISGGTNGDNYSQAFGSATAPTVTVGGSNSTSGTPIVGTHTLSATGGATSSQLGYAVSNTTTAGTLTVNPRALTVTYNGVNKTYDGSLAAEVTYSSDNRLVGDLLSVTQSAAFVDKNVGAAKVVNVSGINLSGVDAANYSLTSTTASTSADIAKAVLKVVANNDAKFVTTSDAAGYAGVSYSGFVNGETSAVLSGAPTVSRSNSGVNTAGTYTGVLVPAGGTASNYSFTYVPGDYTVVPANQLLVRMNPLTTTYGTAPSYSLLSASYYDLLAQRVVTLTDTNVGSSNVVTINDGAGGRASFTVVARNGSWSSTQQLRVGAYALGVSGAVTENSQNFSDTITLIGSHTVNAKPLAVVSADGVSKTYDGNTAINGVNFVLAGVGGGTGVVNGDSVNAIGNGDYATRNAGTQLSYVFNSLNLTGSDADNYYIAAGRSFSGNNGTIIPRALILKAMPDSKVYDGTNNSSLTPVSDTLVPGDSFSGLAQTFDSSAVGLRRLNVSSAFTLNDGNGGSNYVVTQVPAAGSIWSQEMPQPAGAVNILPMAATVSRESADANTGTTAAFSLASVDEVFAVRSSEQQRAVICMNGFVLQHPDDHAVANVQSIQPRDGQDVACLRVQRMRDVADE